MTTQPTAVDDAWATLLKRAEEYRAAFDNLAAARAEAARVQDGHGTSTAALRAFDDAERALHKAALGTP